MDDDRPTTLNCTVVAVECECLWYRVCAVCERSVSDDPGATCRYCKFDPRKPNIFRPSKRLFRILMSIASDVEVFVVVCFDRAAKVLLGCSADELFDFAKYHPFVATTVGRILEGEMLRVTLSKPKNGYSQHLRVASVVPLRTGFQPAITTLKKIYKLENVEGGNIQHGDQGPLMKAHHYQQDQETGSASQQFYPWSPPHLYACSRHPSGTN